MFEYITTVNRFKVLLRLLISGSILFFCMLVNALPKVPTAPYSLSFKQLGVQYDFDLRGVDSRYNLEFSTRGDEVFTKATLKLKYRYSTALLSESSKINVLVNNELALSLPLPKVTADKQLEQSISLPAQLLSAHNVLTLQLVGNKSLQCEDPRHPDISARIGSDSVLELTSASIPLGNDLALLPAPFYDKEDLRSFKLSFVFAGAPDNTTLEAAGIVSSWFGALAHEKRSFISGVLNELPANGHAVVFINGNASITGLSLPTITGPTVAVMVNPKDENGKVLLVMGRDSRELKLAALALSTRSKTMSGQSFVVDSTVQTEPRQPYDAPNWLSSRSPLQFGELVERTKLAKKGGRPETIRLNLRLAPDLYDAKKVGVPVNLMYEYTALPESTISNLTVDLNQKFLKLISLPPTTSLSVGNLSPQVQKLHIPMTMLLPASAQLQFRYTFEPAKEVGCNFENLDQIQSGINPDSTIDLSGLTHFMAMPNLSSFSHSGFPFTRMADLSETGVILADVPSPEEYSTYLSIMARMGESTGYPATAVRVVRANQASSVADKDILLLATGNQSALLKTWSRYLPGMQDDTFISIYLKKIKSVFSIINPYLPIDYRIVVTDESIWLKGNYGMLAGFESPLKTGRSVILVWGAEANQLLQSVDAAWTNVKETTTVGESLMLVQGEKIKTWSSTPTYYVGALSWIDHIRWILSMNMAYLILASAISIFILSILIYGFLRSQTARRSI